MTIRIIVNGARGKMGQQALKAISADTQFELVAALGREADLAAAIHQSKAEVVLDLTRADVVYQNLVTILKAGARAVIGTSGLTASALDEIRKQFFSGTAFIVPNFSLGAILMMKYAREIVRYFPEAEIIEMHHKDKLDAPSGTAIRTAELLAQHRASSDNEHGIPIHSVRLPGLLAHQKIIFGGVGETLSLQHDTIDRICFMRGLILACKKVMEMDGIVVGLEQVL